MSNDPAPNMNVPPHIWLSPISRGFFDLHVALDSPGAQFFLNEEYVRQACEHMRSLRNQMYVMYALSFVGGYICMIGGLPNGSEIEMFGLKVPAVFLSQQVFAAVVATVFSIYIINMISYQILYGAVMIIAQRLGYSSWEFVVAKYDAYMLFSYALRKKDVGYSSGWVEKFGISVTLVISLGTLVLHGAVVLCGCYAALKAALAVGASIPIVLAAFSMTAVVVCAVGYLYFSFIPIKYKLPA